VNLQIADVKNPQPQIAWRGEFSAEEADAQGGRWRWSGNNSVLEINNPGSADSVVTANLAVQTGFDEPAKFASRSRVVKGRERSRK
jgi:hypothetical protein